MIVSKPLLRIKLLAICNCSRRCSFPHWAMISVWIAAKLISRRSKICKSAGHCGERRRKLIDSGENLVPFKSSVVKLGRFEKILAMSIYGAAPNDVVW